MVNASTNASDGPRGVSVPDEGQISPLTADQQRRLSSRRRFLKIVAGGSLGALGVAFAFPILGIKALTQYEDVIAKGDIVSDGSGRTPIDLKTFAVNTGLYGLPLGKPEGTKRNQLELVRVAQSGTADDFRVYSRICTHIGCPVSPSLTPEGHIHCPCHGSQFDANTGKVVHGPAVKTLPHISVTMNAQGQLVIDSDDYSAPIGPPGA